MALWKVPFLLLAFYSSLISICLSNTALQGQSAGIQSSADGGVWQPYSSTGERASTQAEIWDFCVDGLEVTRAKKRELLWGRREAHLPLSAIPHIEDMFKTLFPFHFHFYYLILLLFWKMAKLLMSSQTQSQTSISPKSLRSLRYQHWADAW